nr:hypothetical protein [Tanacetum cinerariifolium]
VSRQVISKQVDACRLGRGCSIDELHSHGRVACPDTLRAAGAARVLHVGKGEANRAATDLDGSGPPATTIKGKSFIVCVEKEAGLGWPPKQAGPPAGQSSRD